MKKFIFGFLIIFFICLVLPLSVKNTDKKNKTAVMAVNNDTFYENSRDNKFKVLITKTNKTVELEAKDYVFGCVASEMPISYHEEALKAQAVASYTYALRKKEKSKKDYDLTDDYKKDQCYKSDEEIKKNWGKNYQKNKEKLQKIIDEVLGQKLIYNGQTALAVYHSVSCGKTLSSKEVWGSEIPYLVSQDSSFDKLAEKYKTEVSVKTDTFIKDFAIQNIKGLKSEKSQNGRTDFLVSEDKKIDSSKIAEKYGLRSCCFDVSVKKDKMIFTVYGYGHGVGMSQNGADYMAKNGSNYKEILLHYYKGCEIK
ncbi:MAG: stage II sporulation protein D [Clostridia bacterium]|nr:stage II sporulation protein D [Clostridia bacterium]